MKNILVLCFSLLVITVNAQQGKGDILLKNGTVITVTKGTLQNTDVLVKGGKIVQIGKNISSPGIKEFDATGQYIMPGIIDCHSHIGIDAVNEGTAPVTPEVFIGDVLNPFDVGIYRALAGGCTVSHALHGSANVIGGESETIKHRWGVKDPDSLRFEDAPRTVKFALGENPIRVHGEGRGIQPKTRMGIEQVLRRAFSDAKDYTRKWEEYNKAKMTNASAPSPAYSKRMDILSEILKGTVMIHCHSYRADEILMLLDVLKDYGIKKIVFQHANEAYKVAPELAAFGASASVFADWWAYKFEVYYSTAFNAAILTRNGVLTSINSDSGDYIRHLYHQAAKSQRYGGLSDEEALAMITINPAKQLGIEKRVGSLEIGKDGDIVVFKNHPLSIYAVPQLTLVDGIIRFDIKNDKNDIRIQIDADNLPSYMHFNKEDMDRCMDGAEAFEYLFIGNEKKN